MPEVSRFFGIIMRMFYDEHNPPYVHAEYQGMKAVFDFDGNLRQGEIGSKTARKLIRDWIDLHRDELIENWECARQDNAIRKIAPLD